LQNERLVLTVQKIRERDEEAPGSAERGVNKQVTNGQSLSFVTEKETNKERNKK
jgi:hypothetical protein